MTNRPILYISCGVPGAGKSTFLNKIKEEHAIIVSRDKIRFSLRKENESYFAHETEVFEIFVSEITKYINQGYNVYADATHLNYSSRLKLTTALLNKGCNPYKVIAIDFDVPLMTCLERNEKRKGTIAYVPREAIKRMYWQHTSPEDEFELTYRVNENGEVSKVIREV